MMVESDGSITIRIGENLNSSNFGTTDGKSTGVDKVTVTSPAYTAASLSGDIVYALKSGNYGIDTKTSGSVIHFDSNKNAGFKVVVTDAGEEKTYTFGPLDMTTGVSNGKKTFTAKVNYDTTDEATVTGVTLEISDFGAEPLAGATGYKGNIKFTIAASAIAGGDASKINVKSVTYYYDLTADNSKTTTVTADGSERYYYTD